MQELIGKSEGELDPDGHEVISIMNHNATLEDTGAVLATEPGVRVYAVDVDQDSVMTHPQITRIGAGVSATEQFLIRLVEQLKETPPEQRTKLLVLGMNNTVVQLRETAVGQPVKGSISAVPGLANAIIELMKLGVKIAFVTDDSEDIARTHVANDLGNMILEKVQNFEISQQDAKVLYYTNGSAIKQRQMFNSESHNLVDDPSFGHDFAMSASAMTIVQEALGTVGEEGDGSVTGEGLFFDYYTGHLAERPSAAEPYRMRPEIPSRYPRFNPGQTGRRNVGFPKVVTKRNVWGSVRPIPSHESPDADVPEGVQSERDWFFDEWVRRVQDIARERMAREHSRMTTRLQRIVKVGDEYLLVRMAGSFSIDITVVHPKPGVAQPNVNHFDDFAFPTKRDAVEDALREHQLAETDDQGNITGVKGEVLAVVKATSSITDRGGCLAGIPGVRVLSVDVDAGKVMQHPQVEHVGHEVEGTRRILRGLIERIDRGEPLPAMIALGINRTILDYTEGGTESLDEDRNTDIREMLARLIENGVKIVFISDDTTGSTDRRVIQPLRAELQQASRTAPQHFPQEVKILFYSAGMTDKHALMMNAAMTLDEVIPSPGGYGGRDFQMSPVLSAFVRRVIGFVHHRAKGVVHANGLLGRWYLERYVTKPEPTPDNPNPGYTVKPGIRRDYPGFRLLEEYGNATAPRVRPNQNIISVRPIPSAECPGCTLPEEQDERHVFFDELVKDLEAEAQGGILGEVAGAAAGAHVAVGPGGQLPIVGQAPILAQPPQPPLPPAVVVPGEPAPAVPAVAEWEEEQLATTVNEVREMIRNRRLQRTNTPYRLNYTYVRSVRGHLRQASMPLETKFAELDRRLKAARQKICTAAYKDPNDPSKGYETDYSIIMMRFKEAQEEMRQVNREAYDIGLSAMDESSGEEYQKAPHHRRGDVVPERPNYVGDLIIAMRAFGFVKEARQLTADAVRIMVQGIHLSPSTEQWPNLDLVSDPHISRVDNMWREARILALNKRPLWQLVIANILYGLDLSADELLNGGGEQGRTLKDLHLVGSHLIALLEDQEGEDIATFAEKAEAARYLEYLVRSPLQHGQANALFDPIAGISMNPNVVTGLRSNDPNDFIGVLNEAWFTVFASRIDPADHEGRLRLGFSRTALEYIYQAAHKLFEYYLNRSRADILELTRAQLFPEVIQREDALNAAKTLDGMMQVIEQRPKLFPQAALQSGGILYQGHVRLEMNPEGVKDPSPIATGLLNGKRMGVYQMSVEMTKEDGTIGRNIEIGVEVLPIEGNEPLIQVQSADMVWTVDVNGSNDILKKSRASLVLDTFVAMGLLPQAFLEAAKGREVEALTFYMSRLFGKGNGLRIYSFANNIQAGSGLAISSLLSAGTYLAMDRSQGRSAASTGSETTVELKIPIPEEQPQTETGYYQVEISTSPNFEEAYTPIARRLEGENFVVLSIPISEFQAGEPYYVRVRYVESEEIRQGRDPVYPWRYCGGDFVIDEKGKKAEIQLGLFEEGLQGLSVQVTERQWEYHDSDEHATRGVEISQENQFARGNYAGMQDDTVTAAWGAREVQASVEPRFTLGTVRTDLAGKPIPQGQPGRKVEFPAALIPDLVPVGIPPAAREALEENMSVMRIGISEEAELFLGELVWNYYLGLETDAAQTWQQTGWMAIMDSILADNPKFMDDLGKVAQVTLPLRQRLGSISIQFIVAAILTKWADKYGTRFNCTGARISGSVELFFPSHFTEADRRRAEADALRMMKEGLKKPGKWSPIDEDPVIYRFRIAPDDHGARLRVLNVDDMRAWRERSWKATTMAKAAKQAYNRKTHALHNPDEVQRAQRIFHAEEDIPLLQMGRSHEGEPVSENLLVNPEFEAALNEVLERKGKKKDKQKYNDLLEAAELVAARKYLTFPTSVNEALYRQVSERVRRNADLCQKVVQASGYGPVALRRIMQAVFDGQLSFMAEFSEEEMREIVDAVMRSEQRTIREIMDAHREELGELYRGLYDPLQPTPRPLYPGMRLVSSWVSFAGADDFQGAIDGDIGVFEDRVRRYQGRTLSAAEQLAKERDEDYLKWLKSRPHPMVLPHNHPLFQNTNSRSYGHYYPLMRDLRRVVRSGGLVFLNQAGGGGTRFGGGTVVKPVAPWFYANQSMSLLGVSMGNEYEFLRQFMPDPMLEADDEGVFYDPFAVEQIVQGVSAFTESAVEVESQRVARKLGAPVPDIGRQSLRRVYFPTRAEFLTHLESQLGHVTSQQQKDEMTRSYNEMIDSAENQLRLAKELGLVPPDAIRAPYVPGGIKRTQKPGTPLESDDPNPLSGYAPSGTAGSIAETTIVTSLPTYSEAALRQRGWTLREELLQMVPAEEREHGMPLAKAALIVEDTDALVLTVAHQSSGMDKPSALAAATAIDFFRNQSGFFMPFIADTAGAGVEGGAVVMTKFMPDYYAPFQDEAKIHEQIEALLGFLAQKAQRPVDEIRALNNPMFLRLLVQHGLINARDEKYVRTGFLRGKFLSSPDEFRKALVTAVIPTTLEGSRAQHMEREILGRHYAFMGSNGFINTRLLWRLSGYSDSPYEEENRRAFLSSTEDQRAQRVARVMEDEMSSVIAIKPRDMVLEGGVVKKMLVLQFETVWNMSIETMFKMGLGLAFFEIDPREFRDPKSKEELNTILGKRHGNTTPVKVDMPEMPVRISVEELQASFDYLMQQAELAVQHHDADYAQELQAQIMNLDQYLVFLERKLELINQ
ncbi:MAG: hypothetical protein PHS88_09140, partial [Candidatus Omnitrophica bacterium]|nr:hypothetical protein [Candidatus Omnitrophota bacterium]